MAAKEPWEQDYTTAAREPWEQDFGPAQGAPDIAKPPGALRRLPDIGITALKGAIAVPEAAVGLADIATGGRVGRFLENPDGAIGFRPKQARAALDDLYSPQQKAANLEVQQAEGFVDTAGAMLRNPSTIAHGIGESVPAMLSGGVVARQLLKAAPRLGAVGASALGEGTVGAGLAAEQTRQETPTGLLTPGQSALSGASGAITAGITAGSGALARRLGIGDIDTMLAGGAARATTKGLPRRLAEGFATEGPLEELPQSMSEQALQNIALDRPVGEGVPEAGAAGLLIGGATGIGAQLLHRPRTPPVDSPVDSAPAEVPRETSPGDPLRAQKQPETGPLTAGVNALIEAEAQAADAGAPVQAPVSGALAGITNADQPPASPVAESQAPGRSADGEGSVAPAQGAGGRIPTGEAEAGAVFDPAAGTIAPPERASFDTEQEVTDYLRTQRRSGGARQGQALPTATPEGRFTFVRQGEPGYDEAVQRGKEREADEAMRADKAFEATKPTLPQHLRELSVGNRKVYGLADAIDAAKTPSQGHRSAALTPEIAAMQAAKLADGVKELDGKLRSGNRTGATTGDLVRAWTEREQMRQAMAESRKSDPALWAAYDERQAAMKGIKVGEQVLTPYPSPEHPQGTPGKLVRKFGTNWRVQTPEGDMLLVPPAALRPVASTTPPVAQSATLSENAAPAAPPTPIQAAAPVATVPGAGEAPKNSQRQESGVQTDPNTTGNGNMARKTADAAPGRGQAEGEGAPAPSPGSQPLPPVPKDTTKTPPQGATAAQPLPATPPTPTEAPPADTVRMYHGGSPESVDGPLWFTRSLRDAKGWAGRHESMGLWYVDVPEGDPSLGGDPEYGVLPPERAELPTAIASARKPFREQEPQQETAAPAPGAGVTVEPAGTKASAETEEVAPADRRRDPAQRQRVADMSPEDMRAALHTDELTGLHNARWLAEHEGDYSHIVAFDADSLKFVNDTLGHDAGDALLKAWGTALKQASDTASRAGGDEFFALANSEAEAEQIAERVRQALDVAEIRAEADQETITIRGLGVSFGVGTNRKAADEQLLAHKRQREAAGARAGRGEAPPGTTRTPRRLAPGQQDQVDQDRGQGDRAEPAAEEEVAPPEPASEPEAKPEVAAPAPPALDVAALLADPRLAGIKVKVKALVADTGRIATYEESAAVALKDANDRLTLARQLLACLQA